MAGRPVMHRLAVTPGQVIGDRDRLAMGDQKPVIGAFERRPAAHPRPGPRSQQIDRRLAAEIMALPVAREMPLMRAPAEFGGLRALAEKPVDRPGVDELARRLRDARHLRVAFGDVDRSDPEPLRELAPAGAVGGRGGARIGVARDIEQGPLDEMRYQPGIGAMRQDRCRAKTVARLFGAQRQRALA